MSHHSHKPSTEALPVRVSYLVKQSHTLVARLLAPILEVHGFTLVLYQILAWLRDGIVITASDIPSQIQHTRLGFTRVIDQLAERGFLARTRRIQNDRRKIDLEITAAGVAAVEMLNPLMADALHAALKDFSDAEMREFEKLLVKFNTTVLSEALALGRDGCLTLEEPGLTEPAVLRSGQTALRQMRRE